MDLGGVESATREDRYSVWCQGEGSEGVDEVSEYEKGEEGFCEFFYSFRCCLSAWVC